MSNSLLLPAAAEPQAQRVLKEGPSRSSRRQLVQELRLQQHLQEAPKERFVGHSAAAVAEAAAVGAAGAAMALSRMV